MFKSNRDFKLYLEDISSECKNIKAFTKVDDKVLWDTLGEEFDLFENTINIIVQNLK